ncbi:sensor histidine kinase [Actinophytocola oryzae]|uniref:histidine kinase n=1 Tax=Actinophytocola oryzae TaxID=502181 RepID=A0A4R7V7Q0_9PSEU|nr:histidine kinase [Actinophytocola oryzae]TDV44947.1 signal transduction histidine kinase [Actinophytocola oryzae]
MSSARLPARLSSGYGDVALAVLIVLLSFVPGLSDKGTDLAEFPDGRPLDWLGWLLVAAMVVPVALRRRWPATCLAVVCLAFAACQLLRYAPPFAGVAVGVLLFTAGRYLTWKHAVPAVAAYVSLAVGLRVAGSPATTSDYLTFLMALGVIWGAGAWMRNRVELVARERRRVEEAVVAAERARIARELHDVVTHHVTAMVVQADAAQYTPDGAASLPAISQEGRRALTDLRYLLGALDGNADTVTKPEALPDLVARSRAAGQPVELVEDGEPRPMAGAAETAAYRVVQEALTNALKHAAGERTVVRLHHGDEWLDLEVTTDGPGRPSLGRGSGRGLLGMRERVSVVGGDLRAGARPDGGFSVQARIPLAMS